MSTLIERLLRVIAEKADGKHTIFAKSAGIPTTTMQGYVKGRTPHVDHLIRIRDTYRIDLNWLLTGEGEMVWSDSKDTSIIYKEGDDPELIELLQMTREVLKSDTNYASSLSANIRSFHESVQLKRQIRDLDSRVRRIEADKKAAAERIRKDDPTEATLDIIKRRTM
ncbi:MAG: helix-turn-helix domain-containing protein [Thermodesulfobacteriota bacterium]